MKNTLADSNSLISCFVRSAKSALAVFMLVLVVLTPWGGVVAAPQNATPFTVETRVYQDPDGEGEGAIVGVGVRMADGHYTYAHSPDVPKPTDVTVTSGNFTQILYPPAVEREDFFEPGKRVPAYENQFWIFIRTPQAGEDVALKLSMLVCSKKNCTPASRELAINTVSPAPMPGPVLDLLRDAEPGYAAAALPTEEAAPESSASAPSISPSTELSATPGFPPSLTPRYADPGLEPGALFTVLWLGLLAGLVLNIMPCVLPVLTIKITALLSAAGDGDEDARLRRFREHNLFFSAGIVSWFVLLALAVSGLGLAWGGLFQQVSVVYGLLILVFLLGLSLFGVFSLPVLDFRVAHGGSPRMQAYASGLVVTLLATPCSGPLLGGVLGWAASQPLPSVILVFISTGIGMSLPYLALSLWPGAARRLPRPGPWTGVVERLAGFFLMGTAVYLLSILPESLRLPALGVLLVAALCAWLWGEWGSLAPRRQQCLVGLLCIALMTGSIALSLRPAPSQVDWVPFSAAQFRKDLGKTPMLLEFTADWCPTCKVLERTVLTPERMHRLRDTYGLRLVKVDITKPSPDAEALLRALGSVSIPVTAIFPAGKGAASPLVLRDLYTADLLEQSLREYDTP